MPSQCIFSPQVMQIAELERDEFTLGHSEYHSQSLKLESLCLFNQEEHEHESYNVESREESKPTPAASRTVKFGIA